MLEPCRKQGGSDNQKPIPLFPYPIHFLAVIRHYCRLMSKSRLNLPFLILVAATLVSIPLVLSFLNSLHPAFDTFSHLRIHLAVLMGLLALPLLFTKLRREGAMILLLAVFAIAVTPHVFPASEDAHAGEAAQPHYRLLQMNLRFDNGSPEQALSLIAHIRPDVVTLEEVSAMWREKFGHIASAYPYSIFCPHPGAVFGVAILSRRPFIADSTPACDPKGMMAVASVDFGGRPVDVAALHLHWPWPFQQSEQIEALSEQFRGLSENAILSGDLNATPWSATTKRIAELAAMTPAPPTGPTWLYRRLPASLRFAGLPIDQTFAKGRVAISKITRQQPIGSDHLPVLVEFSIIPQPETVAS
ncbi:MULTISPECIES: endonuclease/exonuclease/phosphatase family protein [Brucella]|uniref:Endonuclease/exonuclease/phosphatase domain-containing protein n=2 Tax=Brucella TaxID=234 RepID=B0CKV1_BRUSI|nr:MULTISPECIES: endonuclease/exonuclease/phosphatase family protein [Brucella]ABY37731.1 Hypothetical protein BSUIS_A0652 [Brucella suis ATCC 23445]AIJ67335.1 endonuclease/Exonuclease/phosphatase family protein [Brucella suis]EEX87066.1 endonuclease/exonuclease/phosphatase [Brucella ceti B1/94]EEZ08252.1 endonuclease/exonuclease/phosphatase [Brucella ceti M490/95/1]ENR22549.1 hypothetical protein C050_00567 [Brucella suis 92/63]